MRAWWDDLKQRPGAPIALAIIAGLCWLFGQVVAGEPALTALDPPQYATAPTVTQPAAGTSVPASPPPTQSDGATVFPETVIVPDVPAAPLAQRMPSITDPTPPTAPPPPAAGDCAAWAQVFASFGATDREVAFFVPTIIERESGCGRDTLNESTGDTGVCQVNPVHTRAGYFGGRSFGPGGWLAALHNLTTRVDTSSVEWANACLTLYRVCGSGPWQPPYSCANHPLPDPGAKP